MIAAILRQLFSAPWHDYDLPYDGAGGGVAEATQGQLPDSELILDQVIRCAELLLDIRNLISNQSLWDTESDLLNMAAADQRIAERLRNRTK